MSYLIITYDDSSYIVGDQHIKIVQKHWRDKTPFTLYGGKVSISGADIRRIEQSGNEKVIGPWNELGGHYQKILDQPKEDVRKGFWFNVCRLNILRKKSRKDWIYNSTIEKVRKEQNISKIEDIFEYIDKNYTLKDYESQDKTAMGNEIYYAH